MKILVILTLLWLCITACDGATRGSAVTWNLKPDARPAKELVRLAELFSLHHLDSSGILGIRGNLASLLRAEGKAAEADTTAK